MEDADWHIVSEMSGVDNGERKRKLEPQIENKSKKRHPCLKAVESIRLLYKDKSEDDVYATHSNEELYAQLQPFDPDPKNANCRWIYKQFLQKKFTFADQDRVRESLRLFAENANALTRHERDLEKTDYDMLLELIVPWDVNRRMIATPANAGYGGLLEAARAPRRENEPDVRILYRGADGDLRVPFTRGASCRLGRGTRWCTASTSDRNAFDDYSTKGPLLVWRGFESGKRFQFHLREPNFQDEDNKEIEKFAFLALRRRHPVLDALFTEYETELAATIDPSHLKNINPRVLVMIFKRGIVSWTLRYRDASRCEGFERGLNVLLQQQTRSPRKFISALRIVTTYMQAIGLREWPDAIDIKQAVAAFADPTGQAGLVAWKHLTVPVYTQEVHFVERLRVCVSQYLDWTRNGGIVNVEKAARWSRAPNSVELFCNYVSDMIAAENKAWLEPDYFREAGDALAREPNAQEIVLFESAFETVKAVRSGGSFVQWKSFESDTVGLRISLDNNRVNASGLSRFPREQYKSFQFPALMRLMEDWKRRETARFDAVLTRVKTRSDVNSFTFLLKSSILYDWLDADVCVPRLLRLISVDQGAALFDYMTLKRLPLDENIEYCTKIALDDALFHDKTEELSRLVRAIVEHASATRVRRYAPIERPLLTALRSDPSLTQSAFDYWRAVWHGSRWRSLEPFLFEQANTRVLYRYAAHARLNLSEHVEQRLLKNTGQLDVEAMLMYYTKVHMPRRWPAMEPVLVRLDFKKASEYAMGNVTRLYVDADDVEQDDGDSSYSPEIQVWRVVPFEKELMRRLAVIIDDTKRREHLKIAKTYFQRTRSLFPDETWPELNEFTEAV